MAFRVQGKVVVSETGVGIADLVVSVLDVDSAPVSPPPLMKGA